MTKRILERSMLYNGIVEVEYPPGAGKTFSTIEYLLTLGVPSVIYFPNHGAQRNALRYVLKISQSRRGFLSLPINIVYYEGMERHCFFLRDPWRVIEFFERVGDGDLVEGFRRVSDYVKRSVTNRKLRPVVDRFYGELYKVFSEFSEGRITDEELKKKIFDIQNRYRNLFCKFCPIYNLMRNCGKLIRRQTCMYKRVFVPSTIPESGLMVGDLVIRVDPLKVVNYSDIFSEGFRGCPFNSIIDVPMCIRALLMGHYATYRSKKRGNRCESNHLPTVLGSMVLTNHKTFDMISSIISSSRGTSPHYSTYSPIIVVDEYDTWILYEYGIETYTSKDIKEYLMVLDRVESEARDWFGVEEAIQEYREVIDYISTNPVETLQLEIIEENRFPEKEITINDIDEKLRRKIRNIDELLNKKIVYGQVDGIIETLLPVENLPSYTIILPTGTKKGKLLKQWTKRRVVNVYKSVSRLVNVLEAIGRARTMYKVPETAEKTTQRRKPILRGFIPILVVPEYRVAKMFSHNKIRLLSATPVGWSLLLRRTTMRAKELYVESDNTKTIEIMRKGERNVLWRIKRLVPLPNEVSDYIDGVEVRFINAPPLEGTVDRERMRMYTTLISRLLREPDSNVLVIAQNKQVAEKIAKYYRLGFKEDMDLYTDDKLTVLWLRGRASRGVDPPLTYNYIVVVGTPFQPPVLLTSRTSMDEQIVLDFYGKTVFLDYTEREEILDLNELYQAIGRGLRRRKEQVTIYLPSILRKYVSKHSVEWLPLSIQ